MAVSVRKARTREILKQYEAARHRITDGLPVEDIDQAGTLERLTRETVRVLRENKAICVREERGAAVALLGEREANEVINLGYEQAKAEIDRAIATILNDKVELRELKATLSSASDAHSTQPQPAGATVVDHQNGIVEKIERLAELHDAGILNDEEFAAVKARLL